MSGLVEISILLALIMMPIAWASHPPRVLFGRLVIACCVYWFLLLFIAPRLPS